MAFRLSLDLPTQSFASAVNVRVFWDGAEGDIAVRFEWGYGVGIFDNFTNYQFASGEDSGSFTDILTVGLDRTISVRAFGTDSIAGAATSNVWTFKAITLDPSSDAFINSVTQKTINLTINLTPYVNESTCTVTLKYFSTADPGTISETSTIATPTGETFLQIPYTLTGLTPQTEYQVYPHVVRTTSNLADTEGAADTESTRVFQSATTDVATLVTRTTATLNGSVNPNHNETAITYQFEWGTSALYGNLTTLNGPLSGTSTTSFSFPLSGLSPRTTYHYRARAISGEGVIVTGANQTFLTSQFDNPLGVY